VSSKEKYYDLIKENELTDSLKEMVSIPYSKKYKIIKQLIESGYSKDEINNSLRIYKKCYIDIGRANNITIDNVLNKICKSKKE
jgi:predicted transcriptional regulator